MAIAHAKSVPDAGIEDAIGEAETQLTTQVAEALSNAGSLVLSDSASVRDALQLASLLNTSDETIAETIANASVYLHLEEKRVTARQDLEECIRTGNLMGLAEALEEAREAGMPSDEFSVAETLFQQEARAAVEQAGNDTSGNVDASLALALGRAAGLSDADMAAAQEVLSSAAKARLQQALDFEASLEELHAAL